MTAQNFIHEPQSFSKFTFLKGKWLLGFKKTILCFDFFSTFGRY